MASLARRLTGRADLEQRDSLALPFQDFVDYFSYQNAAYPFLTYASQAPSDHERTVPTDFTGIIAQVFRSNAIIYALMQVRMSHFAEARFQYRQIRNGRPGNLFGTADLQILETPWPNGTTGDLLARMLQDADLSGNSYVVRQGDRLARLRPDWMTILLGSRTKRESWVPGDADTEPVAYIYKPGGRGSSEPEIVYPPSLVAHFAPMPDPLAVYRGMSWITPVIRETMSDNAATSHKLKFWENGATVNMVVKIPTENLELFDKIVSKFRQGHEGVNNAYKTLFLAAGADATPVGANLEQADFATVTAAGETRMAAAAGVPPILVGFSEGLKGSSLNAGNYATARRRFADGTIRMLWRQACGALATIVNVPGNAELWYDTRDIAFLKDDEQAAAEIRQADASTIVSLFNAGYNPDTIIKAVTSGDFSVLVGSHNGMLPVQQHPATGGSTNGSGNGAVPKQLVSGGTL